MTPDQQIISLLRAYQRRKRLSDREMAEALGVDTSSWNRLRRGERGLAQPSSVLATFIRLFPRQGALMRSYLTHGQNGRKPAQSSIPTSATPEGQITP